MAEPSLDFIGRQLQAIQIDLQQIKFAADVDRRNAASRYDNLVAALGIKIGAFEVSVEHRPTPLLKELNALRKELNGVRDELVGRFDRIEQLLRT